MSQGIKGKIARLTGNNVNLNRKVLQIRKSINEVNRLIQPSKGDGKK